MIDLYRLVHYRDNTFVLFQGDSDDVEHMSKIVRFYPVDKETLYETGHYAKLRENQREKYELKIFHYLKSNYRPNPLELSIFTTDAPLPRTRRRYEWRRLIINCISEHFEGQGYLADKEERAIYRREPMRVAELELYEGISYTLCITLEWEPLLTCDLSHRYHINGKFASRRAIEEYARGKPEIFDEMHAFETRDRESQFKLIQKFMRRLPAIPETEELRFRTKPITSEELGYETWLWEHEMKPLLEVGQGHHVELAHLIGKGRLGLCVPPPVDLEVIYVYPDATLRGCYQYSDSIWDRLETVIKNCLHEFLRNRVTLHRLPYTLEQTISDYNAKVNLLPNLSNNLLIVMVIPPHVKNHPILSRLEKSTSDINNQLRQLRGSNAYVSTIDWTNLGYGKQDCYVIENCLLKGLMAMGARPWRLANMPLSGSEPNSTCFIGIDATEQRGIIGGVVLDVWGILRGYHYFKIPRETCENANPYTFRDLTTKLIQHFESATDNQVKHLILHRDGRAHAWEWSLLPKKLEEKGITLDLVEIRKRNQPLLRQAANRGGTPSKDIAIGNCKLDSAYLNNTHSVLERISKKQVFPGPQSIRVVKLEGPSPLKVLAAQVHSLTRVNYGAYRRTVNVPATIYYADVMVEKVKKLEPPQTNSGRPLPNNAKLYWL